MAGNVPACESDNERLVTLMMIRWRGRGRGRVRFSHFNKVVAIFQTSGAFCYPGKSEAIYDLYAGGGGGSGCFHQRLCLYGGGEEEKTEVQES